jgi:hypothetical protein
MRSDVPFVAGGVEVVAPFAMGAWVSAALAADTSAGGTVATDAAPRDAAAGETLAGVEAGVGEPPQAVNTSPQGSPTHCPTRQTTEPTFRFAIVSSPRAPSFELRTIHT